MTRSVEIMTTVDHDSLAIALRGMPAQDARKWVVGLLENIDSDLYHSVAAFTKDNPDDTGECQRCHRWTNNINLRMGKPANCDHCKAVLP